MTPSSGFFWIAVILISVAVGGLNSWWATLLCLGLVLGIIGFGTYLLEEEKKK